LRVMLAPHAFVEWWVELDMNRDRRTFVCLPEDVDTACKLGERGALKQQERLRAISE